jgi:hypothetical protein
MWPRNISRPSMPSSCSRLPRMEQPLCRGLAPDLDDILCEHHQRVVNNDNCVSFGGKILQIPPDRYRCHYVKATVQVHRYIDGSMAIFHGPRKLAAYDCEGNIKETNNNRAA